MSKCNKFFITFVVAIFILAITLFIYCHKKGKIYDAEDYFSIQFNENKILNNNTGLHIKLLSTVYSPIGNLWYCSIDKKANLCIETPKTDEEKRKVMELNKKIMKIQKILLSILL